MTEGGAHVAGPQDDPHGRAVAEDGVGPGRGVLSRQLLGQLEAALGVVLDVARQRHALAVVGGGSDGGPEAALVEGDDGLQVVGADLPALPVLFVLGKLYFCVLLTISKPQLLQ